MKYQLNETVYHKDVYDYKEPLTVKGIKEKELLLEGDYSGGTHNVSQSDWLSVESTSRIKNYGYKKECKDYAKNILELLQPIEGTTLHKLSNIILTLTNEIKSKQKNWITKSTLM